MRNLSFIILEKPYLLDIPFFAWNLKAQGEIVHKSDKIIGSSSRILVAHKGEV